MGNVLGIDLGAAYAKAVWIPGSAMQEGAPTLIPVRNGKDKGPTFRVCGIRSGSNFELLSTEWERSQAIEDAQPVVENVKQRRGEPDNVDELEVAVLRAIVESYREQANDFELAQLERVVLAHPVGAGLTHVESLQRLATAAGLPSRLLDTIEEPVALALFAAREQPRFGGTVVVIDAGHYTTDLVHVRFDSSRGAAEALETGHLPLRIGVSELCHALAAEVWLKAQMVAGQPPSLTPFDSEGPESHDGLVRHLCGQVEAKVVRARDMEMFGADLPAQFEPWKWPHEGRFPWLSAMLDRVFLPFDAAAARRENLDDYPHLDQLRFGDRVRRISFREGIRRLQHALGAAAFASLAEANRSKTGVVVGGGMTLIREPRDSLERIVGCHGLEALHVDYTFEGFATLPMGPLLGVAAGSAIAGTRRFMRRNTLAFTLGVGPLWYPTVGQDESGGGALDLLLADDRSIPLSEQRLPIWTAQNGARLLPTGEGGAPVEWMPVYRVLAVRGTEIPDERPLVIELDESLFPHSGDAPLFLVQFSDSTRTTAGTISDVDSLAEVTVPGADEKGLRLALEIRRNEVWRLVVRDAHGRVVAESDYRLSPLSRETGADVRKRW